ncbi:tetratricopeptide repeat protein [Treponema sp.]|uniref:tetratricopeptide repeat protein n=1 Tax=Treponema sp. TaxID=166 RepID=UPI003890F3B0
MAQTIGCLMLLSCNGQKQIKKYETLKAFSFQSNNPLELLYEYDISHPDSFEVKVDIASLYILNDNYPKAMEYLKRAEQVIKNSISKEYLCNYYGLNSSLCLMQKDYEKSLEWCSKSLAIKEHGSKFKFLEGQIEYAMGNKENAYAAFKSGFSKNSSDASLEDKKLYSILLSDNNEIEECLELVSGLLNDGAYYYGLGHFASSLYEKKGKIFESILYAFVDFEYASCFLESDEEQFLRNLHGLELKYEDEESRKQIRDAVGCLTAVIRKENYFPVVKETDCIVYDYIKCKHDVLTGKIDADIITKILPLKNIFNGFPVYHYLVSEVFINGNFDVFPTESLERILDISSNNHFSDYAKERLGAPIGLSKTESEKLMSMNDIYQSCSLIIENDDANALRKICNLISLPDNKYVYFAMNVLSRAKGKESTMKLLEEKLQHGEGRLKERINHILNEWRMN